MADLLAAAPEQILVKRWRCPFCHRSRSSKKLTAEHIARCWLNPANRTCKACANYRLEPGGEPCLPGRHCDCNAGSEWCEAGISLDRENFPVTGCPLWAAITDDARAMSAQSNSRLGEPDA